MSSKPFELGIMVGRFQTIHNGHKDMIDKAIALSERVGIFIGSSQESMTNKNPFSYETREELLKKIYGDAIEVYPLPDIGVGNNSTWGDYVLEHVVNRFGKHPNLCLSGTESRRIDWFDSVSGLDIAELYIPKTIHISATKMREFFIAGDRESWQRYTDPALWSEFDRLREIILASRYNYKTASL